MESVSRFAVLWLSVAMIAGVVFAAATAYGGPLSASAAKTCKKTKAASSRKRKCKKKQATQPSAPAPAPGVTPPVAVTPPVDVTPPAVAITQPAAGAVTGPSGTVIYSTGDSATITCTLDGTPVACNVGGMFTYSALSDGLHTFAVTGSDAAANSASDQVSWMVDANPPVVTSVSGGGGSSGSANFSLTDASGIVEIHCVLDGNDSVCGSGTSGSFSYGSLGSGGHTLDIYAVDDWGNSGQASSPQAAPANRARLSWNVP